jgi:hypothetical protein
MNWNGYGKFEDFFLYFTGWAVEKGKKLQPG